MDLVEVRIHGRGGQGAWTASQLLALAALKEGKQVQSFPEFGPERMGAPITAYTRVSNNKITVHSSVYNPSLVLVLDSTLLTAVNVLDGIKPGGALIVNSMEKPGKLRSSLEVPSQVSVWTVSATEISLRTLGREITNTAMLGALIKAKPIVSLSSLIETVKERFMGKMGELNARIIREAHGKVKSG